MQSFIDEAEQSEPEEPTDTNPGGSDTKWIRKTLAKMQIVEPAGPAAVDKGTGRKLLGHTKGT